MTGIRECILYRNFEEGELPTSLSNIITVDPINGNFVAIEYPDIVIGTIYDIFDAIEERSNEMELFGEENTVNSY